MEGDALVSTWQPFGLSDFVSRQMPDETYIATCDGHDEN